MNILLLSFFCLSLFALGLQIYKRIKESCNNAIFLDSLQEGVILLNEQGRVLQSNAKAKQFFEGKLTGKPLLDREFFKKHRKDWKSCAEIDWPHPLPFFLDLKDGQPVSVTIKPLKDAKHFVFILQDSHTHEQKCRLGKDFVANASHELRTPITIIKGFAETIRDIPQISDAMLKEFVETMIRNCQRMENLVHNLLILEDLDYLPAMRLQECDLVALVDNCNYTLLALYPNISIEAIQNKEAITIPADPDLFELAIMNLLENAVKYSKAPVSITVTTKDLPKQVCITIADKGIGMAKDDLTSIFDRFYTVNKAHARKLGGAGLGLSIVKTIVNKHHGFIHVTSQLGKGTTFFLTFPKTLADIAKQRRTK